jgi:hypothetical protein
MNIRYAGVQFRADGQTDMTKLVLSFRNFANAPNNGKVCQCNDSSDLKTGVESVSNCCVCVPMMLLRQCKSNIHTMK